MVAIIIILLLLLLLLLKNLGWSQLAQLHLPLKIPIPTRKLHFAPCSTCASSRRFPFRATILFCHQLHQKMAHQEGGWPLGLQPLNVRFGLTRHFDSYGSISFSSLLSGSPTSSTDSSADFDVKSTATSFLRERRGMTLGGLLGISGFLGGPSRRWRQDHPTRGSTKARKRRRRACFFFFVLSLCTTTAGDLDGEPSVPSLGHFLEVERRADNANGRTGALFLTYDLGGLPPVTTGSNLQGERNSLFGVDGRVVPPLPQTTATVDRGPLLCRCLRASR